jgi:hypothetical protein
MRLFRGKTKSKKNAWVQSVGGKWHRVDPGSNGKFTACGVVITERWGQSTEVEPNWHISTRCMFPECKGEPLSGSKGS